MASVVEAQSLASITNVAFNPPLYPRNPAHPARQALTLYIARVPGTRDVFLTTMKPRQKIVTAQDVESCLYYLHVDQQEDEFVRGMLLEENETLQLHPVLDFQRKPLPGMSRSSPNIQSKTSTSLLSTSECRKRNLGNHDTALDNSIIYHTRENSNKASSREILRKPLLPDRGLKLKENRKPQLEYLDQTQGSSGDRDATLVRGQGQRGRAKGTSQDGVKLQPFSANRASQKLATVLRGTASRLSALDSVEMFESPQIEENATSITVIRRDPGSGAQWNVAKIIDPPAPEISSETLVTPLETHDMRRNGTPVHLEIRNPGYIKFASRHQPASSPGFVGTGSASSQEEPHELIGSSGNTPCSPDGVFERRLWTEKYRQHALRTTSPHSSNNTAKSRKLSGEILRSERGHIHSESNGSVHYLPRQYNTSNPPVTSAPLRSSTSRSYVFVSPWNGRCEFSTGSGGRSLHCSHNLPTLSSAASSYPPIHVSELRFNLPTSGALSAAPTPDVSARVSDRASYFGRSWNRSFVSSFNTQEGEGDRDGGLPDDLDRLDLSLGQEHAGGGFGGKQAKLGKLIIEDEGIKMLDLIVAANMSLWYRAFAKAQSRRTHGRRQKTSSVDAL